eukprot:m.150058 g.150058  ORF g.150058 m.150058 type:complete len:632 (-) comp11679_c2_seq2:1760-3655(-)
MGKKKSGKKGSGKKKSGKKSKTAAVDGEAPPPTERFVEHQIESRNAAWKRLRNTRDELLAENETLEQEISTKAVEGRKLMERIRNIEAQATINLEKETREAADRLTKAKESLVLTEEENEREVAALKERAAALEAECSERAEYAEGLQNHRRVLCAQWETRLHALKDKRQAAIDTFNADVLHLQRQFDSTRTRFDNVLSAKIEHTKAAASDAAIIIQPVPDRLAYQDHSWLSYELEEQRQEYLRLSKACADLEAANSKLRIEIFGTDCERSSPTRLGIRNPRPVSRLKSAPPRLLGMTRAKTADPQFINAASSLKLFSQLAISGNARQFLMSRGGSDAHSHSHSYHTARGVDAGAGSSSRTTTPRYGGSAIVSGRGGGGGGGGDTGGYPGYKKPVATWVTAAAGNGLEITGTFGRANGNPVMEMTFKNTTGTALSDFAVQFDANSFKLINAAPLTVGPIAPGASAQVNMPLHTGGQLGRRDPLNKLNIAFKATGLAGITYMSLEVPYNVLLTEDGRLEKQPYLALWGEIPDETTSQLSGVPGTTEDIMTRCRNNNIFDIAKRNVGGNDVCYFSLRFINGLDVLAELTMLGGGSVKVALKAKQPAVTGCATQVFKDLLEPAQAASQMQGLLF